MSIDINFSERIWPDREEAKSVLKKYLANDPLVKLSEDDCYRLFAAVKSEEYIFDYFHSLGASTICLTKGKNGVVVSDINQGLFFQKPFPLRKLKILRVPVMLLDRIFIRPITPKFFGRNHNRSSKISRHQAAKCGQIARKYQHQSTDRRINANHKFS